MRQRDMNRQMFHRGHYNVIANQIKEQMSRYTELMDDLDQASSTMQGAKNEAAMVALMELSFALAKRLGMDNFDFDIAKFLEACSPEGVNLYLVWMESGELDGR